MATVDKDFKVATPTLSNHATTKQYVDDAIDSFRVPAGNTFPVSATEGQLFFDNISEHLYIYINSAWNSIAMYDDTLDLPQHIHDTAIDGTGFIVSQFYDGATFNSPQGVGLDAGGPDTTVWTVVFDGGSAVDNFN
jgi:hypothetical protein